MEALPNAVAEAISQNPEVNTNDVPAVGVIPKTFHCQRILERCLNKVVGDILPIDAVLQREQYIKNTKKTRKYHKIIDQ